METFIISRPYQDSIYREAADGNQYEVQQSINIDEIIDSNELLSEAASSFTLAFRTTLVESDWGKAKSLPVFIFDSNAPGRLTWKYLDSFTIHQSGIGIVELGSDRNVIIATPVSSTVDPARDGWSGTYNDYFGPFGVAGATDFHADVGWNFTGWSVNTDGETLVLQSQRRTLDFTISSGPFIQTDHLVFEWTPFLLFNGKDNIVNFDFLNESQLSAVLEVGVDLYNALDGNDQVTLPGALAAGDFGFLRSNWFYAGLGNDTVAGTAYDDRIIGDSGRDSLVGGIGNDTLVGGNALGGEAGDDTLSGDAGRDRLVGSSGNDSLTGGTESDTLFGSSGDDVLDGLDARGVGDRLAGGAGKDVYLVDGSDTIVGFEVGDTILVSTAWSASALAISTYGGQASIFLFNANGFVPTDEIRIIGDFKAKDVTFGLNNVGFGATFGLRSPAAGTPASAFIDPAAARTSLGIKIADAVIEFVVGQALNKAWDSSVKSYVSANIAEFSKDAAAEFLSTALKISKATAIGAAITFSRDIGTIVGKALLGEYDNNRAELVSDLFSATGLLGAGTELAFKLGGIVFDHFLDNLRDGFTSLVNAIAVGSSGNDTINEGDFIYARDGDDLAIGGVGTQSFKGGDGGGNDTYDGGADADIVTYLSATRPVEVDLLGGFARGADIDQDRLIRIEDVVGGQAADTIRGNGFANRLEGAGGNDTIRGLAGHDTLDGDEGADFLIGGAGDDLYFVDHANDVVVEIANAGRDTVITSISHALRAEVEVLELMDGAQDGIGNAANNLLVGSSNANRLFGFAGDDSVLGGSGDDTINGGIGTDSMFGGFGNDVFFVDIASELVIEAADEGADAVYTTAPALILAANVENVFATDLAAHRLTGNDLANSMAGNKGNDTLTGGNGNDTLNGGAGSDRLVGGLDDDTYVSDSSGDVVVEGANQGIDTVRTGLATYTLATNVENLVATTATAHGFVGNGLDNAITGHGAADALNGLAGVDTLTGGAGADTLDGGVGDDRMVGGTASDIYVVDSTLDVVVELLNQGIDTVRTGLASYVLGANVETLVATTSTAHNFIGNALANGITANAGADTLNGAAGNDTLDGGTGIDRLVGGLGDDLFIVQTGDVIVELLNQGTDTVIVSSGAAFTLGLNIEGLVLGGTVANGTGNTLGNTITGNDAANVLQGLAGADMVAGQGGNDILIGGTGQDTLTGGAGADQFRLTGLADSTVAAPDLITDFTFVVGTLDRISLALIDANTTLAADQSFTYRGANFTGAAGDLRVQSLGGGVYVAAGDVDGNSTADFAIAIQSATAPGQAWFIL